MRTRFLPASLALIALGCSSPAAPDESTATPDEAGASPVQGDGGSSGHGSSGGTSSSSGGTTSGSSGSGVGSSSGASSSGSSGSSSGGESSGSSSGGSSSSSSSGGTGSSSGGTGSSSGGPSADESAWLAPMTAARAAVGEAALVWDPIAAAVAQGWANQCDYDHNPNASSQYDAMGGKGGLGEDVAAGAPTESVSGSVADWVGEKQYYDHATNTCASGQVCGHYTQIVWSSTTAVGCAQTSCTTSSPFGTFSGGKWQISVCDFSPPGNYVGQAPY